MSTAECGRLANDLELVPLTLGQVLYESGETMSHAYFPIDCVVSLLYVMKNGESAEIAVVGNEGMIGIALFMGGGVEKRSCECYGVVKKESNRLLPLSVEMGQ